MRYLSTVHRFASAAYGIAVLHTASHHTVSQYCTPHKQHTVCQYCPPVELRVERRCDPGLRSTIRSLSTA
eukprot:3272686-Rhodomonas_salina.1